MKLLIVEFPDAVDITIPRGTGTITITDGTNSVEGGILRAITDMDDPEVPTGNVAITGIVSMGPVPEGG
jgi:hypothetical protein